MVYTLRFSSSKCSLFHNSNVFGSCIIHILYTECAKIKSNSGAKWLMKVEFARQVFEKSPHIKFHENPYCGNRVIPCRWTDGLTLRS